MKYLFIALFLMATVSLIAKNEKQYEFKSMYLEYVTETSGSMVNSSGTETIWYDDYGSLSYTHTKEKSLVNVMGMKSEEEKETISVTKGDWGYFADMKEKTGTKQNIKELKEMGMMMGMAMAPKFTNQIGKSEKQVLMDFVKDNGGNWIGEEDYLGKKCWVYELMGTKQWMYKRVILKAEGDMMGSKYVKKAIKIDENPSIPASKFEPPKGIDYELIDLDNLPGMDD